MASTHASQRRIGVQLHAAWPMVLMPADALVQVATQPAIALIPNCANWLRGVLGRRGDIVPVFDVAAWAGDPPRGIADLRIIVIDTGSRAFALTCAATPEVLDVQPAADGHRDGFPPSLHPYLSSALSIGDSMFVSFEARRWLADAAPALVA